MRSVFVVFVIWSGLATASERASLEAAATPQSPHAQVIIENCNKGGALSRWVYTHMSEVFLSAVVRRADPIVELPVQLRPEMLLIKLQRMSFQR